MALASLGFDGGPQLTFRINPSEIQWGYEIHTNVEDTVAGRVVQITGATLRDAVVVGYLGENRKAGGPPDSNGDHAGASWRLHEAFVRKCRDIMAYQSRDSTEPGKMHPPATFNLPTEGIRWRVYLKDVADPDGSGGIEHRTGKFSHAYALTLFVVQQGSDALTKAGASGTVVDAAQANAIKSFIERISEGIGWKQSKYNGGLIDNVDTDKGQEEKDE